jgi:hypothetical protein
MADISTGTLYEINKSIMAKEPILTAKQIIEKEKLLVEYFNDTSKTYYMLLNKELSDYTVLRLADKNFIHSGFAAKEIIGCANNRGKIQAIDKNENNAIEIWIMINKESYVYYLFPYDEGVIEC